MKFRTSLPGLAAVLVMSVSSVAFAQQRVTNLDASGTIASTGVYQTLQKASEDRRGCTIQNNGTHSMSVRFAGVTVWAVPAGSNISCNNGDIVLTDKVEITGTAGDAFTASFQ